MYELKCHQYIENDHIALFFLLTFCNLVHNSCENLYFRFSYYNGVIVKMCGDSSVWLLYPCKQQARPFVSQCCCWESAYDTLLYWNVLQCTGMYCIVLECTAMYWNVLYCTGMYCTVLDCTALYWNVRQCSALHCSALHCTAMYCIVLYCSALHITPL